MNRTYIRDLDVDCEQCGATVELHAGATQCSNFDCPTNDHESDLSWYDALPDDHELSPK